MPRTPGTPGRASPVACAPLTSLVPHTVDAACEERRGGGDYRPGAHETNTDDRPPPQVNPRESAATDGANVVTRSRAAPSGDGAITGYLIDGDSNGPRGGRQGCQGTPTHFACFGRLGNGLANASRHAGASRELTELDFGQEEPRLSVSDNGRGLPMTTGNAATASPTCLRTPSARADASSSSPGDRPGARA